MASSIGHRRIAVVTETVGELRHQVVSRRRNAVDAITRILQGF